MPDLEINPYEKPGYAEFRRNEWLGRIELLIQEMTGWATAENWPTERRDKLVSERYIGAYTAPELLITLPAGELLITPIGLNPLTGNGRVDIEATPTLNRVRLIPLETGWRILTDSNVPYRVPWNREGFKQLADDLLA